jgi:mersacidin/lichenicidin family type 2 lantibiotic
MNSREIVRGWKDEEYLLRLRGEKQALLPDNPAGLIELEDEDLGVVEGGTGPTIAIVISVSIIVSYFYCSFPTCPPAAE